MKGSMEIVRLLLGGGANNRSADGSGDPVLAVAVERGAVGICRLLLRYGADIGAVSGWRKIPLLQLALTKEGGLPDGNHCSNGAMTRLLLENRAPVNSQDVYGATAFQTMGDRLLPWAY